MDSDQIELRMRCLELAVKTGGLDVVATAQAFHDFAVAKDEPVIDLLESLHA